MVLPVLPPGQGAQESCADVEMEWDWCDGDDAGAEPEATARLCREVTAACRLPPSRPTPLTPILGPREFGKESATTLSQSSSHGLRLSISPQA